VENAIKHAIAPYEFGGTIRIGARLMGQALEITVSDSGPLRGLDRTNLARLLDSDRGVGLRNTRERLDHSFGKEASLDFALSDPHGLLVVIKMPAQSGNLSKVDTARAAERSTNGFMRNQAS